MRNKTTARTRTTAAPKAKSAAPAAGASRHGWVGGLDALASARQEGAKVFETLLKKGQALEQRTKQAAADTAGAATAKAREMQQMANGTWDKLEQVFEDRVARALSKLGIYTQNDIQRLTERVDELSAAVNRLLAANGKPIAAARRGTAKRAAGVATKTARKPAAVKRAAKRAPKQ
jgi:poly(hydroxyalkanoate) granule-associated protein